MKKVVYFLLFLLICATACRKKQNNPDRNGHCNYALFALKKTIGATYKIVSIDTASGKSSDNLPFSELYSTGGFLSTSDNCYYSLRSDDNGTLLLTRFDLLSRTEKTFKGPNWGVSRVTSFDVAYSTLSSKFYFLYSNPGTSMSTYTWQFFEISLGDSAFTYYEIQLDVSSNFMFRPLISNPVNGMIYFRVLNDYAAFTPGKKVAITLPGSLAAFQAFKACEKDQFLYGIQADAYGVPLTFSKVDPVTFTIADIADVTDLLKPLPSYAGFDQCREQYIIQNGDSTINLLWLDIKDGTVRKRLTINDSYTNIMCVNNLPAN